MKNEIFATAQKAVDFTFHFQIANLGVRHAYAVEIRAIGKNEANTIFRDNWSSIERLARENLTSSSAQTRLIRLLPP